jgi:hypothetical protein
MGFSSGLRRTVRSRPVLIGSASACLLGEEADVSFVMGVGKEG